MHRLILVNALIFAVLASAIGLAYYGYSYTNEVSTRERAIILDTMQDLAEEKVAGIEGQIVDSEDKLFKAIELEPLSDLEAARKSQSAAVQSIFVLDEHLEVVPGGYASSPRRDREAGIAFRKMFLSSIAPTLPLRESELDVRGHVHATWNGLPYLFSFVRRMVGDRTYYIVLEADLSHLIGVVFPQYFAVRSPRLYQVI